MDMFMDIAMEMSLSMGDSAQSIPLSIHMDCQMDCVKEPPMAYMGMAISAMGQNANALAYVTKEGEDVILYTSADNGATWHRTVNPEGNQLPQSPDEVMDLLTGQNIQAQKTGTAEVNGKPATVYTGKVNGQQLQQILNSTGAAGEMSEAVGMDVPEEALANLGDILVTFMIDEETGLPVRYIVDMTAAMGDLMAAAMAESMSGADMEGLELKIDVSSAILDVTLSRFDGVEPIVIPEAALDAPEA